MANRKRNMQLKIWISQEEKDLIYFKMAQVPTDNIGAYIRKMSIDGYIINVDMSEIKKSNSELQIIGKNINPIAKRVNSTNSIYADDITELKAKHKKLTSQKTKLYAEYKIKKAEKTELDIIKTNIDGILKDTPTKNRSKERER